LRGPDSPGWIAQRAFRALLYGPDHPYGHPPDGSPQTVKDLSDEDIRAFYRGKFAANRSTLIVVGDVEPDALMKTLEGSLAAWKTTGPEPPTPPPPSAKREPGIVSLADKPGAVQSVVRLGRLWVDRNDPRYFATLIGNRVLGGDFLSRLNRNLREEHGYTYGAHSVILYRKAGSVWAVDTDVRADVTAPALKEIVGELDGVSKDRPFTS